MLTKAERAILIKQFQILASIEDDDDGYPIKIEVLSSGYEAEYEDVLDGLSEPLNKVDCKHVQDGRRWPTIAT